MKIIVAGGGTGGHIYPNIAVLETLKKRDPKAEILYLGSGKAMESELVPKSGYRFEAISCGKLRRYFSWENFLDFFRTNLGIIQSIRTIADFKPDVIFCKGGYVSLPVAIAGGILKKPVIIHESDLEMGLANRIAAKFARVICVSFPETAERMKGDKRVVLTGNPVRPELAEGNAEIGWKTTGVRQGKKNILVMGGSQGSEFINNLIWDNLPELLRHYNVLHSCGAGKLKETGGYQPRDGYFACETFGSELRHIYAITDLFISRAGAGSLAEMELIGKPVILVPLVFGSRGDQIKNAESYAKTHKTLILDEKKINNEKINLPELIDKLMQRKEHTAEKKKIPAADRIVGIILRLAKQDESKA